MTFLSFLSSFIGRTVEVAVPNDMFEGTLISVQSTLIAIQQQTIQYYGPGLVINIPTDNIDYVRVLA